MFKRHFIFVNMVVLLLGMVLSCDKSYRQYPAQEGPCPVVFDGAPDIAVQVETRSAASETKSTWTGSDEVWVYGVPREKGRDGNPSVDGTLDLEHIFIDRVSCDPNPEDGIFHVYDPSTFDPKTGKKKMYDYEEGKYYDFFAYDTGGATLYLPKKTKDDTTTPLSGEGTPADAKNAAASTVSFDVVIDGSQDVRLGWANKWTDAHKRNWYPERTYSATAARHGVNPHLSFYHMLSKFQIYIFTGYPNTDPRAGEYDNGQFQRYLTITRISVRSATRARLNVVRPLVNSLDENNPIAPIIPFSDPNQFDDLLLYKDGRKMDVVEIVPAEEKSQLDEVQPDGEVMLMPGSSEYTVKLTMQHKKSHDKNNELENYEEEVTVRFPEGEVAKPGYLYKVKLKIWGPQSVSAEATLAEWKDSGQFNLDPDNEYN